MAGIVYEFTPGWSVYASYSQSFLPQMGQDLGRGAALSVLMLVINLVIALAYMRVGRSRR